MGDNSTGTGYLALLAEILKAGIDNPDYFREPCGRHWCMAGGLDPEYLWRMALRHRGFVPVNYVPIKKCLDPKAWIGQRRVGITPDNFKHTMGKPGWGKNCGEERKEK